MYFLLFLSFQKEHRTLYFHYLQIGAVPESGLPGRVKDAKDNAARTLSVAFKSLGAQKKNNRGAMYDLKEQQVCVCF